MRYFTGGLIVSILTIVAFSLKSDPALAAGCPGYSSSAATISPCVGPPNSIVIVTMRRRNIVPQAVSFHTGVKNGIAVGGLTTVTQGAAGYTFVVPAALCAAGSGSQFAVKLSGANNQDEGEIGRFTIDCRARLVSGRYRVVSGVFVAMFSLTVNSSNITGTAKWQGYAGIDTLRGSINGDRVTFRRDCRPQSGYSSCSQTWIGTIRGKVINGTWTGTGGNGTWTLQL